MEKWVDLIESKGRRVYSQGNQDGIIEQIFKLINTTNKFCVEFGFNSKKIKGANKTGANVARLILEEGWNYILFDMCYENTAINLYKETLTPENIGDIYKKYGVPIESDYISIDVDSIDLWLFKAMLNNGYRPRLVSVEYNCNFPIDISATVKIGTSWSKKDNVYGASLLALNKVAEEYGYCLMACMKCLDLFFIRKDLVPANQIPPLNRFSCYTNIPFHTYTVPSLEKLACIIEYPSMKQLNWKG